MGKEQRSPLQINETFSITYPPGKNPKYVTGLLIGNGCLSLSIIHYMLFVSYIYTKNLSIVQLNVLILDLSEK